MNTKRLVMSFGMLAFVGAVVVGGTGAFFSDTETSEGNVFTAGSVTVGIEGIAHTYNGVDANNTPIFGENGVSFILEDLKPLDEGQVDYDLVNGENEAYICALVTETENNDNGINGPEGDAGDTTDGVGNGELGDFLNFKFGTETGSLSAIAGQWQTVGTAAANASAASGFEYCFGEFDGTGSCVLGANDDNLAQTDSLTADVQFYAVQTRNNADFTCGDLDEPVASDYLYETGFEEVGGNSSWISFNGTTTIVSSGTGGVPSAEGGSHALADGDVFSRLGGYSDVFPVGGYTAEIDVYLDMAEADGTDKRFDYSVASNGSDDNHQRDFIFHVGTNPSVAGQWGASVSNNAPGWPLNPGASPVDITTSGWYTLQAYFYDNAGVLAVDMKVIDAGGTVIGSWTRTNPVDTIPAEVGGNRYAWLLNNPFSDLPIDNARLYLGAPTI